MASTATTRSPLSRERVFAAALSLIARDGIAGLSMRRLAAELGVEAMSLYHHVSDKADVLDGVVATVLDEMVLPTEGRWDERTMQIAHELRRVVRAHPNVHTLVVERAFRSPSVLGPANALLAALSDGGLAAADLVCAFWTLLSFVSGSLSCEMAEVADGLDQLIRSSDPLFGGDEDRWFDAGLAAVTASLVAT